MSTEPSRSPAPAAVGLKTLVLIVSGTLALVSLVGIGLILAGVVLVKWAPEAGPEQPPLPQGAEFDAPQRILTLLNDQKEAWNRGDLEAFMDGYSKKNLVYIAGTKRLDSWEALRDHYRATYQADGKQMGTLAFREEAMRIVSADTALVRGRWSVTAGDTIKEGHFTLVLRREPDGWKIIEDHTS